jgi:ABC-type molybdenum transport system ATPase subunit/photorepair protein PhrA
MIERIYIDNYKTFQNFEWKPGPVALLMGRNGTGKSTVFDLLHVLQDLICNERSLMNVVPGSTCTRWDRRATQKFELDVTGPEGPFRYRLALEHHERGEVRVTSETLHLADVPLFSFDAGQVQLYNDQGRSGPSFSGNWRKSGLGTVVPGASNKRLTWFKGWLADLLVLRPNPAVMDGRASGEDTLLLPDVSNFASWYRYVAQERPRDVFRAAEALSRVIDCFRDMSIRVDEQRTGWLRSNFVGPSGEEYQVRFEELSDGQRVLFALYVVLYTQIDGSRTIALDEPDNFVSLDEIQPFLMEMLDRALGGSGPQLLVISHHPEYLNQLAPNHGHVLHREQGGPTRIRPFAFDAAVPPSEIVARGGLQQEGG